MSIEAVSWALSTQRVATPMQRLVLIAVANHADKRGQSAWPSQETLAEYCCCSSRTIRRQLSELEESGDYSPWRSEVGFALPWWLSSGRL